MERHRSAAEKKRRAERKAAKRAKRQAAKRQREQQEPSSAVKNAALVAQALQQQDGQHDDAKEQPKQSPKKPSAPQQATTPSHAKRKRTLPSSFSADPAALQQAAEATLERSAGGEDVGLGHPAPEGGGRALAFGEFVDDAGEDGAAFGLAEAHGHDVDPEAAGDGCRTEPCAFALRDSPDWREVWTSPVAAVHPTAMAVAYVRL